MRFVSVLVARRVVLIGVVWHQQHAVLSQLLLDELRVETAVVSVATDLVGLDVRRVQIFLQEFQQPAGAKYFTVVGELTSHSALQQVVSRRGTIKKHRQRTQSTGWT